FGARRADVEEAYVLGAFERLLGYAHRIPAGRHGEVLLAALPEPLNDPEIADRGLALAVDPEIARREVVGRGLGEKDDSGFEPLGSMQRHKPHDAGASGLDAHLL